jgi:hypothetical protein
MASAPDIPESFPDGIGRMKELAQGSPDSPLMKRHSFEGLRCAGDCECGGFGADGKGLSDISCSAHDDGKEGTLAAHAGRPGRRAHAAGRL